MPSSLLDICPLIKRDTSITDFPLFIDMGAHFANPACPLCVGSLTSDSVENMWNNTKIVEDQGVSLYAHAKAALPAGAGCAANLLILGGKFGDPVGVRTRDTLIKS